MDPDTDSELRVDIKTECFDRICTQLAAFGFGGLGPAKATDLVIDLLNDKQKHHAWLIRRYRDQIKAALEVMASWVSKQAPAGLPSFQNKLSTAVHHVNMANSDTGMPLLKMTWMVLGQRNKESSITFHDDGCDSEDGFLVMLSSDPELDRFR